MSFLLRLKELTQTRRYWSLYIIGSLLMLAFALYIQFVREELPCLMCIQVRILMLLLILVATAGLLLRNNRLANTIVHFLIVLIAVAFTERAYQLLGTERGFVFGDCGFDLGLPAWLALEEWLPWLFRIETPCGYTPVIAFGITIAEAMMVISVPFLLVSISFTLASLLKNKP